MASSFFGKHGLHNFQSLYIYESAKVYVCLYLYVCMNLALVSIGSVLRARIQEKWFALRFRKNVPSISCIQGQSFVGGRPLYQNSLGKVGAGKCVVAGKCVPPLPICLGHSVSHQFYGAHFAQWQ